MASSEGAAMQYFTAHEQGKAAVRLRPKAGGEAFHPPPGAGIHRWQVHIGGRSQTCYGAHAPVILHYPNADFGYWRRKYEMLTVDPSFGAGSQISLKGMPRLTRLLEKEMSRRGRGSDGRALGASCDGEEEAEGAEALAQLAKHNQKHAHRGSTGLDPGRGDGIGTPGGAD